MNARTPDKPRFVAGSIGPTTKQLSIAGNVERSRPSRRDVRRRWSTSYYEQVDGAGRRRASICCCRETAFDTLVLKACLFAIESTSTSSGAARAGDGLGHDRRGRPHVRLGPDGRSVLELDLARPDLLSVGMNCALGPDMHAAVRRRAVAASRRSASVAIRTPACRTHWAASTETPR